MQWPHLPERFGTQEIGNWVQGSKSGKNHQETCSKKLRLEHSTQRTKNNDLAQIEVETKTKYTRGEEVMRSGMSRSVFNETRGECVEINQEKWKWETGNKASNMQYRRRLNTPDSHGVSSPPPLCAKFILTWRLGKFLQPFVSFFMRFFSFLLQLQHEF